MLCAFVLLVVFFWQEKSQIQSLQKGAFSVLQLLQEMPVGASHKGYPPRRPPTQNNKGSKIINHQALSGAFVSLFYLSSFGKKIPNPKPSKSAISCTTTLTKSACWTLSQRVPPLRPPTQNNKGSRIINLQAIFCYICLRSLFCTIILKKNCCWTLLQRKRAPKS